MFTYKQQDIIPIVEDAANFVYCYQKHKEINDAEKEVCK